MKARERKRARMVAKYAEKRAALKAAGDWEGLQKLPPKQRSRSNAQSMPNHGSTPRLYAPIWCIASFVSKDGLVGKDPRC